jgi:hypothetical protein
MPDTFSGASGSLWQSVLLVGASALAGAINSVAGGGTLLTFPALTIAGFASTVANATSTVALWPGQITSLWGFKSEIGQSARGASLFGLVTIGLAGGATGAYLLTRTPTSLFDRLVPFLVLTATLIFMAQEPLTRWQKRRSQVHQATEPGATVAPVAPVAPGSPVAQEGQNAPTPLRLTGGVSLFLLLIALYGGYFGAGIGILTLAALGLLGLTNIHQMNGIKAVFTLGVNGIAAILFIVQGLVDWRTVGIMAIGSLFGGYAGAGIARRIGQKNVRRVVIAIGLVLSLTYFIKH